MGFVVNSLSCCRMDARAYSDGQKRKQELFKRYGFRVVELVDRNIEELDDRLPGKLLEFFPKGDRFR